MIRQRYEWNIPLAANSIWRECRDRAAIVLLDPWLYADFRLHASGHRMLRVHCASGSFHDPTEV